MTNESYAIQNCNEWALPETPSKGCINYLDDGYCVAWDYTSYDKGLNSCIFRDCLDEENKVPYCPICEIGYYTDYKTGECVVLPEGKDSYSEYINKIEFSLLFLLISLLA